MVKGETMTPTPEGFINTSEIWQPEVEEEKVPWEKVKKDLEIEIDLPELS
jgi:hypothetical protein